MGYYISTKAWEDEAKREVAVDFVKYMTSDQMVADFAEHTASALKNAPDVNPEKFNSLQMKAIEMMEGATSLTVAAQDFFDGECRESTFDGMPRIVMGEVSAEDAVAEGISEYTKQTAE